MEQVAAAEMAVAAMAAVAVAEGATEVVKMETAPRVAASVGVVVTVEPVVEVVERPAWWRE